MVPLLLSLLSGRERNPREKMAARNPGDEEARETLFVRFSKQGFHADTLVSDLSNIATL